MWLDLRGRFNEALAVKPRGRIHWVDTARGLAIVLVVLFHSGLAARHLGSGQLSPNFQSASEIVDDMRMPLFFFCSGILAFWGLSKPWAVIFEKRVGVLLWIIFVWTIIYFAFESVMPVLAWGKRHPANGLFVVPLGTLWFMYALAGLSILMRAIHSRAMPYQLAVICLVNVGAMLLLHSVELGGYHLLVSNLATHGLLCFAGGIWLAPVVTKLLATRRRVICFAALAAMLLALDIILLLSLDWYGDLPKIVQCIPKVIFGITFAALVTLWNPVQSMCAWLGSRTLEIFLFHALVIGVVYNALDGLELTKNMALLAIFPSALAGSILCTWLVDGPRLRLLFRPPAFFFQRGEKVPQLR